MNENPEDLPLVERFHKAEYLTRELSEHLRQAFLPKLSELRHASKVMDEKEVTDQEMLDRIRALLAAEDFATNVFDKLMKYLRSIEQGTRQIIGLED
jgi:signal recognition particle GTPase